MSNIKKTIEMLKKGRTLTALEVQAELGTTDSGRVLRFAMAEDSNIKRCYWALGARIALYYYKKLSPLKFIFVKMDDGNWFVAPRNHRYLTTNKKFSTKKEAVEWVKNGCA